MASTVSQNTFLSTYNDDYRDSDHYHRILFNNGRALQARELTQMQTIIQAELARLSEYIFKEGAIFDTNYGALSSGFQALSYIKVLSLPTGFDLLVGSKLTNPDNVTALVKAVIPATTTDPATILLRYISSNNSTSADTASAPKTFRPADVLSYDTGDISGTITVQVTNTAANPAIGKGSFIELPQFNTFVHGHLVMAEAQSLVIDKYSARPSGVIGFKVTEEVITAADNIALYDNSGSTPNLTAPGADRYRITCTLALQSQVLATETFHPLVQLNQGIVTRLKTRDNVLSQIGTVIAGRTNDIAGDFIVSDAPQGRFDMEVSDDSDIDYLRLQFRGGVAFIGGNRVVRDSKVPPIRILKPRNNPDDLETKNNEFISASYGNYFLAGTMKGLVSKVQNLVEVNLYNQPFGSSGSLPGSVNMSEVAQELQAHGVGLSSKFSAVFNTLDNNGFRLGDVDNSGTITSNDALAVLAYAEGIDSDSLIATNDSATNLSIAARIKANLQQNSTIERAYTSSAIGTARIRNIDEFDDEFRIHVFDVKMDSDGAGFKYGIKDVRSIGDTGTNSVNYANLATVNGKYDLQDRSNNSLLFPLPLVRVQETSNVVMTVRKIYTDTTNSSGEATFSTGSSNIFTDPEQWIVAVDSSGEVFSPPTISGSLNTSATVVGLPTSSDVTMLGYETITAIRKTKTLQQNQTAVVSITNREFKLSRADIYRFRSVVDDDTGEDITYKFIFDNGQRDNFYTIGGGRLKEGAVVPTGTVTVTYDYFSHNAGDFFGGKASYPDVEYEQVPTFTTSTGVTYRLTDVIDMRPIKNNTGTAFTGTGAVIENIPRNGDTIIIGTARYWQPRVDIISLSSNGVINHTAGETSFAFKEPDFPKGDMPLYKIGLLPYTFNKKEVFLERFDNRGYKMSDIRRLDTRLSNIEALTSLTISEINTKEITIEDPYDASIDRIKTGITGDTFNNNNQSELTDPDYRARINKPLGTLGVIGFVRELPLVYDSDLSVGTIKKQSTIWPKYTEEVLINQAVASRAININSFDVGQHIGVGVVEPSYSSWTQRKLVDENFRQQDGQGTLTTTGQATAISSQGNQEEHDGQIQ